MMLCAWPTLLETKTAKAAPQATARPRPGLATGEGAIAMVGLGVPGRTGDLTAVYGAAIHGTRTCAIDGAGRHVVAADRAVRPYQNAASRGVVAGVDTIVAALSPA